MTSRPSVLVTHEAPHQSSLSGIAEAIRDRVPSEQIKVATSAADTQKLVPGSEIVVAKHLSPDLFGEEGPEWVQSTTAGLDDYDTAGYAEAGVALTSAAGVNARPVAEQALAFMFAFERRLIRGVDQDRNAEWQRYTAGEMKDSSLAIVGLGEVGTTLARLANLLGIHVEGSKRDTTVEVPEVETMYPPEQIHELVDDADYVVLTCSLTEETRELIDDSVLGSMRDDAVLINVARGEVVDEDALLRSVQKNYLRGAALDVQSAEPLPADHDLWSVSNILITPHMAGSTAKYDKRVAEVFASHLEAYRADPTAFRAEYVPSLPE